MLKNYSIFILGLIATSIILVQSCGQPTNNNSTQTINNKDSLEQGKELFNAHCNSCHMAPKPSSLPKNVWEYVLPFMAAKMGLMVENYKSNSSPEDSAIEEKNHLVPKQSLITLSEYRLIKEFILNNAPQSLPFASSRLSRNKILTQFKRENYTIIDTPPSLVTALAFNQRTKTLSIGCMDNQVIQWTNDKGVINKELVTSTVSDFTFYKGKTYFTQIGQLMPSEQSKGIFTLSGTSNSPILKSLHRPVCSIMEDINKDGIPEIVVGNFGKNLGSLSLFSKKQNMSEYIEYPLLSVPGAVSCYFEDMDDDGLKDIVALFAQGDESVYVFFQKENLTFEPKRIMRFPPNYGTTHMVLVDYNEDGLIDIVTANGDNADYSVVLKDYHGIRVHINQGNNNFKETFFYPVYGATKVLAEDFDKDGDIDFAINCFFPDYYQLLQESFVYLKNENSNQYKFTSSIMKDGLPIKSMTMIKGDIDNDGDVDIMLGNFAISPIQIPEYLDKAWKQAKYGLIILENNLK